MPYQYLWTVMLYSLCLSTLLYSGVGAEDQTSVSSIGFIGWILSYTHSISWNFSYTHIWDFLPLLPALTFPTILLQFFFFQVYFCALGKFMTLWLLLWLKYYFAPLMWLDQSNLKNAAKDLLAGRKLLCSFRKRTFYQILSWIALPDTILNVIIALPVGLSLWLDHTPLFSTMQLADYVWPNFTWCISNMHSTYQTDNTTFYLRPYFWPWQISCVY